MPVTIREAAAATPVSAKMIRHDESVGPLPPAKRTDSGYRTYTDADVHMLRFVRQARDHGFSIKEIGELLGLSTAPGPARRSRNLKSRHIAELDHKIQLRDRAGIPRHLTIPVPPA